MGFEGNFLLLVAASSVRDRPGSFRNRDIEFSKTRRVPKTRSIVSKCLSWAPRTHGDPHIFLVVAGLGLELWVVSARALVLSVLMLLLLTWRVMGT